MPGATTEVPVATARRSAGRAVLGAVVLVGVYVVLGLFVSTGGSLGTDSGGKVATEQTMADRGTLVPDVGYWARAWDPDARVHGLIYTTRFGDRYVNVTSVVMPIAAEPLWALGGKRLALALPMAGAVATAFAARALAKRLRAGGAATARSEREAWIAFWIVGLGSPVLVYALDFWEHTIGLACMAWGVVVLLDALDRPRWWRGLLAGAAFGAAFSVRTEGLLYAVTSIGIVAVVLLARRRVASAFVVGATAVVGFGALVAANAGLEVMVLGQTLRSGRTAGAAGAIGTELTTRLREGFITTFSPFPGFDATEAALSVLFVAGLVVAAWTGVDRRRQPVAIAAAGVAGVVAALRAAQGLGFVPGLVAAWPFAAVGLARGWQATRDRIVVLLALVPLPLAFLSQFPGGAVPQWGGRYILLSGFLLAVVGVARSSELLGWVRTAFVVLSVVVTAAGVGWLVVRSHDIAAAAERIEARPEPVLIAANGFLPREFGASYGRKNWLAPTVKTDLPRTFDVVRAAGVDSFGLVLDPDESAPEVEGFRVTGRETVPVLGGLEVAIVGYERDPGT